MRRVAVGVRWGPPAVLDNADGPLVAELTPKGYDWRMFLARGMRGVVGSDLPFRG